ncbi:Two-component response regulator ARR1 -like protein [Gossypium arboreum]|uniref:Two-component response regulator ARR1-like protein n=1 Tax=Gossypium arboreum TaxID=29729 RepID=A0A0B0P6X2_GOSAR|nr:Two-component response regulator ARR1 -like protein [Gossypium arboreum]
MNGQTQKLEHVLSRLEEERLKIDAFKRKLTLCMQLLANVMKASRQQLHAYRANQGSKAIFEEFIPLNNSHSENTKRLENMSEKANLMITEQLWRQTGTEMKSRSSIASPAKADIDFNVGPKLDLDTKVRNGGAFLPLSKDRNSSSSCAGPTLQPLPDLKLASISKDMEENKCSKAENDNLGKVGNGGVLIEQGKGSSNTIDGQTTTIATPKQIRELMKVEGLTNDEVKSHLQKYRLHTRRPNLSPQPAGPPTSQLVVLGGIWVPSEYATAVANTNSAALTLYGAHHPPLALHLPPHFCASPVPQEFYTATTIATPALSQQLLHHQLHYKANSQAHSSPESDVKRTGNHSESIEDNKSESSSRKGESGDNGSDRDQRKGLGALTLGEEGEESNGCDITLKF